MDGNGGRRHGRRTLHGVIRVKQQCCGFCVCSKRHHRSAGYFYIHATGVCAAIRDVLDDQPSRSKLANSGFGIWHHHCDRGVIMKSIRRNSSGFALINVLVATLVFSLALLGLAGLYTRFVVAQTQNQNLLQLAPWSNSFWGIVQANMSTLATMANTYDSTNIASAPAPLRAWLTQLLDTTASPAALPNATVQIATGPDASSGAACTSSTGCTVTVTVTWSQNGSSTNGGALSRTQTFNYQFGL